MKQQSLFLPNAVYWSVNRASTTFRRCSPQNSVQFGTLIARCRFQQPGEQSPLRQEVLLTSPRVYTHHRQRASLLWEVVSPKKNRGRLCESVMKRYQVVSPGALC